MPEQLYECLEDLAKLHKADIHRRKIEHLLEYFNLHTECSDFANERYEKYIRK